MAQRAAKQKMMHFRIRFFAVTVIMLLIVYLLVMVNRGETMPQEQLRNVQGTVIGPPVLHSKFDRQTDSQTLTLTQEQLRNVQGALKDSPVNVKLKTSARIFKSILFIYVHK